MATGQADLYNLAGNPRLGKRGRKPGKHSDKNYTQTSIYLPIELRNHVRAKLYERGLEMSGLVEGMLRHWLENEGGIEPVKDS